MFLSPHILEFNFQHEQFLVHVLIISTVAAGLHDCTEKRNVLKWSRVAMHWVKLGLTARKWLVYSAVPGASESSSLKPKKT